MIHTTKKVTIAKNGYIVRMRSKQFNDVDTYILFNQDGDFIDKSVDYNDLHKQLSF